jgi:hypothetical protein
MRIRLSIVRFLFEAAFLVLVAAAAGLADLEAVWIGVVMFGAWLLVAFVERTGSRRVRRVAEPEPQPEPVVEAGPELEPEPELEREPKPEPEPEPEPVLVSVPAPEPSSPPDPPDEPEPETVIPLALHDPSPRAWNLWELERLAEELNGDSRAEERSLLLMHMREFADPSGDLPLEFDPLVRDAFGAGLAELVT